MIPNLIITEKKTIIESFKELDIFKKLDITDNNYVIIISINFLNKSDPFTFKNKCIYNLIKVSAFINTDKKFPKIDSDSVANIDEIISKYNLPIPENIDTLLLSNNTYTILSYYNELDLTNRNFFLLYEKANNFSEIHLYIIKQYYDSNILIDNINLITILKKMKKIQ